MTSTHRTLVLLVLVLACAVMPAAAQTPAAAPPASLTQEQMANFLLKAEIGRVRPAG